MNSAKLAAPVIELLTQDEIHAALVRAVLQRHVSGADAFVEANHIDARVAHRIIRLPDGGQAMLASVVLLGSTPRQSPTESTPLPGETKGR